MILEPKASLLGRDKEIEQLMGHLGQAYEGRGLVVVISGPAGIGKTMLAEELEKVAKKIGFTCLKGYCDPQSDTPTQPFKEIFPELSRTGTSLRDGKETISPITLQEKLQRISIEGPVLLRIENLHWASREGAALVHYIARNCQPLRILVLCTFQPSEMAITSAGPTPFLDTLRLMRREGICQEIELAPLNRSETLDVVQDFLGGRVDDELAQQIWVNSDGNPFVAMELARLLVQGKKIEYLEGQWIGKEDTIIEMPDSFQELAERKLEQLTKEDRRIIESASVIGETFDPEVLVEIMRQERLHILERLDLLARENRLLVERGDRFQFINKSTHLAAYYNISALRKKELHYSVAKALEKRASSHPADIALQYYLAGQKESSLCYSLLAGQVCCENNTWSEAVEYYQRALEASDGDDPVLRFHAMEKLADSMFKVGKKEKARDLYQELAANAADLATRDYYLKRANMLLE